MKSLSNTQTVIGGGKKDGGYRSTRREKRELRFSDPNQIKTPAVGRDQISSIKGGANTKDPGLALGFCVIVPSVKKGLGLSTPGPIRHSMDSQKRRGIGIGEQKTARGGKEGSVPPAEGGAPSLGAERFAHYSGEGPARGAAGWGGSGGGGRRYITPKSKRLESLYWGKGGEKK